MLEGVFEINNYEMDEIFRNMNQTNVNIDDSNDEAKKDFVSYKQSGVFGNGIKTINDQMDTITNSMMVMSGAIQKGTQAIFETEFKLLQEARDLEIPKGFETSNITSTSVSSNISLNKNDGKSVNNGTASSKIKEDLNSSIHSKENLTEMNDNTTLEQRIDENIYTNNKIKLASLETQSENKEETFQDYKETGKIQFFSIDPSMTINKVEELED